VVVRRHSHPTPGPLPPPRAPTFRHGFLHRACSPEGARRRARAPVRRRPGGGATSKGGGWGAWRVPAPRQGRRKATSRRVRGLVWRAASRGGMARRRRAARPPLSQLPRRPRRVGHDGGSQGACAGANAWGVAWRRGGPGERGSRRPRPTRPARVRALAAATPPSPQASTSHTHTLTPHFSASRPPWSAAARWPAPRPPARTRAPPPRPPPPARPRRACR